MKVRLTGDSWNLDTLEDVGLAVGEIFHVEDQDDYAWHFRDTEGTLWSAIRDRRSWWGGELVEETDAVNVNEERLAEVIRSVPRVMEENYSRLSARNPNAEEIAHAVAEWLRGGGR